MTGLEIAAWIPAAIWLYLLGFHGRFWLPTVRLPGRRREEAATPTGGWPSVAVVVPARDEAEMIDLTLPFLLAQRYPGRAEVFVVDDASSDGTASVARSAAARSPGIPLCVVTGTERPAGWVGKTWALQQGVSAAEASLHPDFFLFTDADIRHPPDSVARLVSSALGSGRDLVSLMARLRAVTGWERMVVPAFVYFFSQLYPFRWVTARRRKTAAAAGGCILVRRQALQDAGGIAAIAGAVIDDVALGRAVKDSGGSCWLGYADDVTSIRPYPRLADLWDMVARSAYTQLRYSPLLLAGTVAGLALLYLGPVAVTVAGAAAGDVVVTCAGAVAWAVMTLTFVPMVSYYRLSPAWALTLPLTAVLYGAMTVDSARRHRAGTGSAWKGRTYTDGRPLSG